MTEIKDGSAELKAIDAKIKKDFVERAITEEEEMDIMSLAQGDDINKTVVVGRWEFSLRNMRSGETGLVRKLCSRFLKKDAPPTIDMELVPFYDLAICINSITVLGKEIEWPDLVRLKEVRQGNSKYSEFLEALEQRYEIINSWPPNIFAGVHEEYRNLMTYIYEITRPDKIDAF